MTPLFTAVQSGNVKIVQLLVDAGANMNLKDDNGRTVLNCAFGSSPQIFQALLATGANPNTEDSD
jgi:ankyrin repeat protein